jgi:hypothetical protein
MNLSSPRSGSAWIVSLSLLGAALVTPVIEVGDLLEEVIAPWHPAGASDAPPRLERRAASGVRASTTGEKFFVVGQYVAVGAERTPRLVLEPVARLVDPRPALLSLARAGRMDQDRGPPVVL